MKHVYSQRRYSLFGWLCAVAGVCIAITTAHTQPAAITRSTDFQLFDNTVAVLPNGNIVVADPGYGPDSTHSNMGAVYLYDGRTKALLSKLTGSTAQDQVGSGGITVLANGNYVVRSPEWNNGAATQAGAVTWGDGRIGIQGVVSAANSLVGSHPDDQVGNSTPVRSEFRYNSEQVVANTEVTVLPNGNYVVSSPYWNNGRAVRAGAVTWGNGLTGTRGVVSPANSLVGTHENDQVGNNTADNASNDFIDNSAVLVLPNGNYVISSPSWTNGSAHAAGAVTWASGQNGIRGNVSQLNSLVGSHADDHVGTYGRITVLANGNYVVSSPEWKNRTAAYAFGAVTWANGQRGIRGVVSAANSLVGAHDNDYVGIGGVTVLPSGNYVVSSPSWTNGSAHNAGAVTWGNGERGIKGVIRPANSLVGLHAGDNVGSNSQYSYYYDNEPSDVQGITVLANGNYVVSSPDWRNRAALNAGAVTWGDGKIGIMGNVSPANSLVGAHANDHVGTGVMALPNGHYVVRSPEWTNSSAHMAGAVTWGNGQRGITGVIRPANSLVGSHPNDQVGLGVTALTNGNYVVSSPRWNNGPVTRAGAVTWANGRMGITGVVNQLNSLVGAHSDDQVGNDASVDSYIEDRVIPSRVTALPNGHYVVSSPYWNNGSARMAGALTWGNGKTGTRGVVSPANSLVGSASGDLVSSGGITALPNGHYVVSSPYWRNGAAAGAGAVTWGVGQIRGVINATNSLVGTKARDLVGSGGVTVLANGNFVVSSPYWKNRAGAVTWSSGQAGVQGKVSPANSLVDFQRDEYGADYQVQALPNGNYLVSAPDWQNGTAPRAGAITWGSGQAGVQGSVSAVNSLVGVHADDQVGSSGVTVLANGNYVVSSSTWKDNTGAITWGSGQAGVQGSVSETNSLVGTSSNEETQVAALANGDFLVRAYHAPNGSTSRELVITPGHGTTGLTGVVGAANSLGSGPSH